MKAMTITRLEAAQIALASAIVLAFCSIAASQIMLGLAIVCFLSLKRKPNWPEGMAWAAAFLGLTLLAALVSGDPKTALPQIRKLYLWTLLPLGATLLARDFPKAAIVWPLTLAGLASALWSFCEYYSKWVAAQAAGQDFYLAYVAARITGFMSHWMTFGAHMMIGFSLAGAVLLFTRRSLWSRVGLAVILAIYAVAILLGQTRSIWLGMACSSALLLACWRPWSLLALPVLAVLTYLVAPAPVRARMESIVRPHGQVDSNDHRVVTRAAGWNMIAAHPWLGLGPEGPGKRGLPALFCFLMFVGVNIRGWLRRPSMIRYFALAAMAGLAASGLFEHNLGDSEVLTLFLALFGLAAVREEEV
jgi:putative inorganic carbon (HCO3(-)) transporter